MADGTNQSALAALTPPSADPLDDLSMFEPDPSVAVVADAPLLRRRILAALDFDRLPVTAEGATPAVLVDAGRPPPRVVTVALADGDPVVPSVHETRRAVPEAGVVLVLERMVGGPLRRALRAGAMAAVEAARIESTLAIAVRGVAAGLVVVPDTMRERLEPPALSPREREVLALAADGATTSEIAARLTVSLGTVKRHLSSCFAKLGVENRGEALALLIDADRDPNSTRSE